MRRAALLVVSSALWADELSGPWMNRVEPLGARRGETVTVKISGKELLRPSAAWFDTTGIEWLETIEASAKEITGRVRVSGEAALGPHLFHFKTAKGRTNTRLFNVTQFPSVIEAEPNDVAGKAQRVEFRPQVLYGYAKGRQDIDLYEFEARAGERWVFDLRSIEYGSHLECELALLDEAGRVVAFNDDRDDYIETPRLEYRFPRAGTYRLKLDQYRGPQGVSCAENCGYLIEMSRLPVVMAADPLGLEPGRTRRVRVFGSNLDGARTVTLSSARAGEYYRLTFPFTVPVAVGVDAVEKVAGVIAGRGADWIDVDFTMPASAKHGLWRVWIESEHGVAEGVSLEVAGGALDEAVARRGAVKPGVAIDGRLSVAGEVDSYWVDAVAGQPVHAYTLATQMGLPLVDTVLELFDEKGKFLADHDDLMTGQGTVIGNPDSSLFYTPKEAGRLRIAVRDRTGRGGPTFAYRLHVENRAAGFRLLTEPEEFRIRAGGSHALEVLLIPDPGFNKVVEVWAEGLPEGVAVTKGRFRADLQFGPSGDGDNVLIPALELTVSAPPTLKAGEYPFRVYGKAEGSETRVEAFTTLWIGAPRKRNDIRRPLPAITMSVTEE